MTLGQRIRLILMEQDLKQVDFAKTLGISANYVSLIANDKKNIISDTLAKLIEETYGYSSQWILSGCGEKLLRNDLTIEKTEIIMRVKKMSDSEVRAVLAFVNSLDSINPKKEA